ncbi:hypothetical protein BN871_CW_00070 [Paenibacillus sp. P22]|nr:hypothetical protein BN871_CW_00070 [Paenibacillus sp. P22]
MPANRKRANQINRLTPSLALVPKMMACPYLALKLAVSSGRTLPASAISPLRELIQTFERVPLASRGVDYSSESLRIVPGYRVKQQDGTGMKLAHYVAVGIFRPFLSGGIPILVGDRPEHIGIAVLLARLQHAVAENASRRTQIVHFPEACQVGYRFFHIGQLPLDRIRMQRAHIGMAPGMVADQMALGGHPLDEIRLRLDIMARDEKDGRDLLLLQYVQNLRRKLVLLVPVVEGQIQLLLGRIAEKNRLMLLKHRHEALLGYRGKLAVFAFFEAEMVGLAPSCRRFLIVLRDGGIPIGPLLRGSGFRCLSGKNKHRQHAAGRSRRFDSGFHSSSASCLI